MLNRDFLKRLVFRFSRGQGGWLPWYNFYTGSSNTQTYSQLMLSAIRPDPGMGHRNPVNMAQAFVTDGNNPAPLLSDNVVDAATHVRFVRGRQSGAPQAIDLLGGVKQSVVLQNFYMGYVQYGDDPEGLQRRMRIPLAVADLDPDVLIDPVPGPFNFETAMDIYMDPDMQGGGNVKLSKVAIDAFRARMTAGDRDGNGSYSIDGFHLNPYADSFNSNIHGDTTVPFITSSNLDYDPTRPMLRFAGFQYGPHVGYMLSDVDPDILKLNLLADPLQIPLINPNCVLLALHCPMPWYMPVAAVLQGGVLPTTVLSPVYKALLNRPSFNVLGFTANTDPVVASFQGRPRIKSRNVITIDRPGTVARGSYRVERYSGDVIEHTLTSHLPYTDCDGNPAKYFTKHSSLVHDNNDTNGMRSLYGCLQPVAFPAGQMPEDPWIWFVSMDDEHAMWLNRQEIGKATVAECVARVPSSPIQLVVNATSVFLLYGSELRIWNIADATWTVYTTGVELPSTVMHSIALDREKLRTWVGHENGVFEVIIGGSVDLDLSSIPSAARRVAKQALVAVNGYLAWNTVDYFSQQGEYEPIVPSYVVRYNTTNSTVFSWTFRDVTSEGMLDAYTASYWKQLGKVGLRSNGEILITHSEPVASYSMMMVGLSWFKVRPDGTLFRKHWCQKFSIAGPDATYSMNPANPTNHMVYMPPVHRIDDCHYVTGSIPFRYPMQGINPQSREKGLFVFEEETYGTPTLNSAGPSQIIEFRLDDEASWLYLHPRAYSRQADTSVHAGTNQFSDLLNLPSKQDSLIPQFSLVTRGPDFEFALYSMCVVLIDGCYAAIAAGSQHQLPMGIEYDWDGNNWIHKKAGRPPQGRALHNLPHPITPHVSVAFDTGNTGFVFQRSTCYRFDSQPGTTAGIPQASLYLGDYAVVSETVTVDSTGKATVAKAALDTFCGIDVANTKDMYAQIGVLGLTLVASNPGVNEYAVTKDGVFHFHMSRAGASASITYNFISQAI